MYSVPQIPLKPYGLDTWHWWQQQILTCSSMLLPQDMLHQRTLSPRVHWWKCWYFYVSSTYFLSHMSNCPASCWSDLEAGARLEALCLGHSSQSTLRPRVHWWHQIPAPKQACDIDGCRFKPPNRPATLMNGSWKPKVHRWMGLENQKCIDEWVLKTKSASMNGSGKPKVHRWMGLGNQKCIDEWVLETKSASMNGSWKPKVHRWMGLENQKCIDEWVLETKSASMNGSWKPKVHRWMGLGNQKCIDEWVLIEPSPLDLPGMLYKKARP